MPGFYTTGPIITDPGNIFDYEASSGEAFEAMFDNAENNPAAILGRTARYLTDRAGGIFEAPEMVTADAARAEIKKRGLDSYLTVPDEGIARYELNAIQYLKQRELERGLVHARARSTSAAASAFAGGLAIQATDPINAASAFIPIVPELRYAGMLARAGTSTFGRALTRAGVGFAEGAAGAALVEPLNFAGSQFDQADYGIEDSLANIAFGAFIGSGLHVIGGAIYDARMTRALRSMDQGLAAIALRKAAANAPEEVQLKAAHQATALVETDQPVRIEKNFADEPLRQAAERERQREFNRVEVVTDTTPTEPLTPIDQLIKQREAEIAEGKTEPTGTTRIELPTDGKGKAWVDATYTTRPGDAEGMPDVRSLVVKGLATRDRGALTTFFEGLHDHPDIDEIRVEGVTSKETGDLLAENNFTENGDGSFTRATEAGEDRRVIADARFADSAGRQTTERSPSADDQSKAAAIEEAKRGEEEAKVEQTPEDVNAETQMATAHLASMEERGEVTAQMRAYVEAAEKKAIELEDEARAYEMAAQCPLED